MPALDDFGNQFGAPNALAGDALEVVPVAVVVGGLNNNSVAAVEGTAVVNGHLRERFGVDCRQVGAGRPCRYRAASGGGDGPPDPIAGNQVPVGIAPSAFQRRPAVEKKQPAAKPVEPKPEPKEPPREVKEEPRQEAVVKVEEPPQKVVKEEVPKPEPEPKPKPAEPKPQPQNPEPPSIDNKPYSYQVWNRSEGGLLW